MTEGELMAHIEREVRNYPRLAVFWPGPDSRKGWGPGFPDLTIVGRRGIIWREVKGNGGFASAEQRRWGWQIRAAGGDWSVWLPDDWRNGRIGRELGGIA